MNPDTTTVSKARTVDVPTATILRCFFLASLIAKAIFGETSKYSESI